MNGDDGRTCSDQVPVDLSWGIPESDARVGVGTVIGAGNGVDSDSDSNPDPDPDFGPPTPLRPRRVSGW